MSSMPRVAIIVLNYNGGEDTLACLNALENLDYPACEIVVVDNGSSDGSPEKIRADFPATRLIETGANLGFTGGNNAGLRYALDSGFDYAFLLNNDTEVAPDFLGLMISEMETNPSLGATGPLIAYYHQPEMIWSAGGRVHRRWGLPRMLGNDELDQGQFGDIPFEVDYVTGCAMLVKRKVLEDAGLLDERFFMYFEEVEWCARIRRAGFGISVVPRAKIWHKIQPQARNESPFVHYLMTRNRLLWIETARLGWLVWGRVFLLENVRTFLSWSLRPRWKHKGPQRKAMLQAWRDYFLRRFGPPQSKTAV